jgi:sulfide:quinone oxidoreductase
VPLDKIAMKHGFELIVDGVTHFDASTKRTTLASGRVLADYTYVVLALGQDKVKHKGLEHTLSICGAPEQSLEIRDKIDQIILSKR